MITILGIDPGTHVCGTALVESDGPLLRYLWSNSIRLLKSTPKPERLARIYHAVHGLAVQARPDAVAMESGFVGPSGRGSLTLAEARGVILAAVTQAGVDRIIEVTPGQGKRAATGKGGADKATVQRAVKVIFGLQDLLAEDEADAVAIALAGINRFDGVTSLKSVTK